MFRPIKQLLQQRRRLRRYRQIYGRFRPYTMVPWGDFAINLELAEEIRCVPGTIVECGVWRGGMSAAIAKVLGPTRSYYLFDSFEGLPQAMEIDGPAALAWQSDKSGAYYHDNCSAPETFAIEAMAMSGAMAPHIVKGWFERTLGNFEDKEGIALLRLDADWYDSTRLCLEMLFDKIVPGGLIIIDDYYVWDGCSRAVHDFLSRRNAMERIRTRGSVCYIQRASA